MVERPLNILSVTDLIPLDEPGGSGRASWEISRALANLGHNITIITKGNKHNLRPDTEILNGLTIYRHFLSPLKLMKLYFSVGKTIKADIMIFHSPFTAWWFKGLTTKIPAVMFHHSPWNVEYEIRSKDLGKSYPRKLLGSFLRKKIEHSVLKSVKKIFTASRYMCNLLLEIHGLKSDIIHLGVDTERFYPVRDDETKRGLKRKFGIKQDAFVIFTVRNLVSRMGLENLITAFGLFLKEKPKPPQGFSSFQLVIGGSGYLKPTLEELASQSGVKDETIFAGYIPDDKLPDYYRAADLFVLPTKALEGFGLVTLEALASGVPVIATPVGSNEEILSPLGNEFLFKGSSTEAIYEGLKNFVSSYNPAGLSDRCREYVLNNFSWQKCASEIETKIYEILARK